ncbi:hypothetical protein ACFQH9_06425 [Pseudonocardia lutea]|uniref:Uncharacterized protein n=1 Tax=Pseudonocardia lutea TaxID=2172015 RepID=A0ABW1I5C9_9PSEU
MRTVLRVGLAVLVIAVVGGGLWFLLRPAPTPQTPVRVSGLPAFGQAEADGLASTLRSGDPARLVPVLPLRAGESVDPAFASQLAAMPSDIDPATFTGQDPQTATVRATSGDKVWMLVLRRR